MLAVMYGMMPKAKMEKLQKRLRKTSSKIREHLVSLMPHAIGEPLAHLHLERAMQNQIDTRRSWPK